MKRWTIEEENKLISLINDHKLYEEIATILDRTRDSIACRCKSLHISATRKLSLKSCQKCSKSHNCRTKICTNCGYKFDKKYRSFAEEFPELLKEWDYEKNILNPNNITSFCKTQIFWKCKNNHLYKQSLYCKTIRHHGCPYCSGRNVITGKTDLQSVNPILASEWCYEKNILKPNEVSHKSSKMIWWICNKKHIWRAEVNSRSNGKGCPYCSGRIPIVGKTDLQTVNPLLASEWDYQKNNLKPNEISCYSSKKVWWICNKNHVWKSSIVNRSKGCGCPYCSNNKILIGYNDLWTTHPDLCKELVNIEDGYKYSFGSNKKICWKCKKCNHIWKTMICSRTKYNSGCPKCNKSKGENEVLRILDKFNIKYELQKIFNGCKNKQDLLFDFYLPYHNICIEYQGEFHYKPHWSSNGNESLKSTQKCDQIKRDFCKKEGIKLIEIPYWDYNKIEIIIKDITS